MHCALAASPTPTLHEAVGPLRSRSPVALSPPLVAAANIVGDRLASLRSAAERLQRRACGALPLRGPDPALFRSVSRLAAPLLATAVPPLSRRSAFWGCACYACPMSPVPRASSPNRSATRFRSRSPRTAFRAGPSPRDGHIGNKSRSGSIKKLKSSKIALPRDISHCKNNVS